MIRFFCFEVQMWIICLQLFFIHSVFSNHFTRYDVNISQTGIPGMKHNIVHL